MEKVVEANLRLELLRMVERILPYVFEVMSKGIVNVKLGYTNTRLFYVKDGIFNEYLYLGPSNTRKAKRLLLDVIQEWKIEMLALFIADLHKLSNTDNE